MKKSLYLLIFVVLFYSCTNKNEKEEIEKVKSDNLEKKEVDNNELDFQIGIFTSVPDTIDGCGDFYNYILNNSNKPEFVFLSNLSEFSMMKINGKTEYFKINQDTTDSFNEKKYVQTASSAKYNLICEFDLIEKYDEGGLYNMKLTIVDKFTRRKKIIFLKGESGC